MKLGLFIGRLNPPHNGHLRIIQMALEENDKVLLLLGTPKVSDEKNPLSFTERKELLEMMFPVEHITIKELRDAETDELWIETILQQIQQQVPKQTIIIFYGGDFAYDSAYKSFTAFSGAFSDFTLRYKEVPRKGTIVEVDDSSFDLSATNFRRVLKSGDTDIAKQFTSEKIFKKIEQFYKNEK